MKKATPYIVIAIIVAMVAATVVQYKRNNEEAKADTIFIPAPDTIIIDSSYYSFKAIDSLKQFAKIAFSELKKVHEEKQQYEKQIAELVSAEPASAYYRESDEVINLRKKLAAANEEISRLKNEIAYLQSPKTNYAKKIEYPVYKTEVEKPDDSAIVITTTPSSPNTVIYLIPFDKEAKKHMLYEPSCDPKLSVNKEAKYFDGKFFFNRVSSGKYLIKICTYYGNYMVVNKTNGRQEIKMKLAPPLQ